MNVDGPRAGAQGHIEQRPNFTPGLGHDRGTVPPHDLDLERDVLAGLSTSDLREFRQLLEVDDFYAPSHRDVLKALQWLDLHDGVWRAVVVEGTRVALTVKGIGYALATTGAADVGWARRSLEQALAQGCAAGEHAVQRLRSLASIRAELATMEDRRAELLQRAHAA